MKFLISLIAIAFLTKECDKNKDSLVTSPVDTIETISEVNKLQESITFEYTAISRGMYYHIVITNSTVSVKKNSNSKGIYKACSKEDWSKLIDELNTIDLKNISKFEAPTQARLYDGAATAQLIIMQDKATFKTNSFDHGKPPLEIEALVKKILSLSENIE
ncbi:MAG: hypothetical protein KAJ28_05290 [Flavobacteriaceae bacterium]|nr:hypothetical protein [Flavobacteriaceae bacterium]